MKKYNNSNIKALNTFGINTIIKSLIIIENYDELKQIFEEGIFKDKFFILGGGSNVLFLDNFDGHVIKVDLKGNEINPLGNNVIVTSYAGENWDDLVKMVVDKGYGGMENLSLIPGSVGATAVQNIGAYGVEAQDLIMTVEYFDLTNGEFCTLNKEECEFSYRSSIFKTKLLNKAIITKVVFNLKIDHTLNIQYPDVLARIEKKNYDSAKLSIKNLRDIICDIRLTKLPYPHEAGNAGSFFKNPIISKKIFESIVKNYPDVKPNHIDSENIKLSAGWLIEKAGWKGWTSESGKYGVSQKHALVLVNYGGASGKEIYELSSKIKSDVRGKFNIELEEEVVIVN